LEISFETDGFPKRKLLQSLSIFLSIKKHIHTHIRASHHDHYFSFFEGTLLLEQSDGEEEEEEESSEQKRERIIETIVRVLAARVGSVPIRRRNGPIRRMGRPHG
jgi:hypothetical protein